MLSFAQRALSAVRDRRIVSGIRRRMAWRRRNYLRRCKGVVHIGANDGAEREEYARHGLRVLWIEPIPDAFAALQANIAGIGGQDAMCALIADRDGDTHILNIASHGGACSSILEPGEILEVLPNLKFTSQLTMTSVTLASVMRGRDTALYDALVIDTQGAELLVPILRHFRYVECEGADFAFYEGYPHPDEIKALLAEHGFRQVRKDVFRETANGQEFDMLFRRG
jgi:FkbM family methyltransferase